MTAKRFVPRPDTLRLGHALWDIVWLDADEFAIATGVDDSDGVTMDQRKTIYIRLYVNGNESHYQDVLMHELTHAVWATNKMTLMPKTLAEPADELEERVILLQTPTFMQLLRENPDIIKYLASTR